MERIGLVGLGRMGQALAGRLLEAGSPLAVHNRTRAKAEPLLARGATWAELPAALAEKADIVRVARETFQPPEFQISP
jgi:3-hydroxyisobutyrate dehydrogenase